MSVVGLSLRFYCLGALWNISRRLSTIFRRLSTMFSISRKILSRRVVFLRTPVSDPDLPRYICHLLSPQPLPSRFSQQMSRIKPAEVPTKKKEINPAAKSVEEIQRLNSWCPKRRSAKGVRSWSLFGSRVINDQDPREAVLPKTGPNNFRKDSTLLCFIPLT